MNQTTNYQLSQWEPTDRILMSDFNADNAKIDAALAGKVGRGQLIRSITTEASASVVSFDLSDLNWNDWEQVALFFGYRAVWSAEASSYLYCDVNEGAITTYCSAGTGLARSQPNPFQLIFLPRHDAAGQVRTVCFGSPGGAGVAECTYSELEQVRIFYMGESRNFPIGMELSLWGVK